MSERTFRRWRDRFQAEGAEGLYDRRLGRVSGRRAGVDEVAALLDLFDTKYRKFTARHFWEKLTEKHDFKRSYNWVAGDASGTRQDQTGAAPRGAPAQAAASADDRHDAAPRRLDAPMGA